MPLPADKAIRWWQNYRNMRMESWGPLRLWGGVPAKANSIAFTTNDADNIASWYRDVSGGDLPLKPGTEYQTSSFEEASFLLHVNQEFCISNLGTSHVFRGQANHPQWTVTSTLARSCADDNERLASWAKALVYKDTLERVMWAYDEIKYQWRLQPEMSMPAARHAGCVSPLIDITVDPSVAGHFARHQARTNEINSATIYAFDTHAMAQGASFHLLPPPMLRSARQMAVYYDTYNGDGKLLDPSHAVQVTFPVDAPTGLLIWKSGPPGDLLRDGELVDLYHQDQVCALAWLAGEQAVAASHHSTQFQRIAAGLSREQFCEILRSDTAPTRPVSRVPVRFVESRVLEWFALTTDLLYALLPVTYRGRACSIGDENTLRFVKQKYHADTGVHHDIPHTSRPHPSSVPASTDRNAEHIVIASHRWPIRLLSSRQECNHSR